MYLFYLVMAAVSVPVLSSHGVRAVPPVLWQYAVAVPVLSGHGGSDVDEYQRGLALPLPYLVCVINKLCTYTLYIHNVFLSVSLPLYSFVSFYSRNPSHHTIFSFSRTQTMLMNLSMSWVWDLLPLPGPDDLRPGVADEVNLKLHCVRLTNLCLQCILFSYLEYTYTYSMYNPDDTYFHYVHCSMCPP